MNQILESISCAAMQVRNILILADIATVTVTASSSAGVTAQLCSETNNPSVKFSISLIERGQLLIIDVRKDNKPEIFRGKLHLNVQIPQYRILKELDIRTLSGPVFVNTEEKATESIAVTTTAGCIDVKTKHSSKVHLASFSGEIRLNMNADANIYAKLQTARSPIFIDIQNIIDLNMYTQITKGSLSKKFNKTRNSKYKADIYASTEHGDISFDNE